MSSNYVPTESPLADTIGWFRKAIPTPGDKNFHTQLGCHLEEVQEMLDTLEPKDNDTMVLMSALDGALEQLANHLKANTGVIRIRAGKRAEFLDAICDQLVTAGGAAYMVDMDPVGGLEAVNISNYSKFGDDGEPIFDANRKVIKGPNYVAVDLEPYV